MKKYFPVLLLLLIIACKKGDTGPAGPQGEKGEKGDNGATGTANVIYSNWLSIELKSGVYASTYYAKIDAPKLTQDILDKGDIRLFFRSHTGVFAISHESLPGLYYQSKVGAIEIFSPTKWDNFSGYAYRYVLIPGGVFAGGRYSSGSSTTPMDYEELARRYNIPATGSNE